MPHTGSNAVKRPLLWVILCSVSSCAQLAPAETKLDFWHSYLHQPSGVIHYSFQIASYKRGLFFGSCGPSTRSLRWEYDIDLTGAGLVYQKDAIRITSDLKNVEIVSGTITVDQKRNEAAIDLQIKSGGNTVGFTGNGTNHIVKIK